MIIEGYAYCKKCRKQTVHVTTLNPQDELQCKVCHAPTCSFCDRDLGIAQEHDGNGTAFYCCGSCYALVLHGGIVPDDIKPVIAHMRKVNQLEEK